MPSSAALAARDAYVDYLNYVTVVIANMYPINLKVSIEERQCLLNLRKRALEAFRPGAILAASEAYVLAEQGAN